jgi:hypothetical protein
MSVSVHPKGLFGEMRLGEKFQVCFMDIGDLVNLDKLQKPPAFRNFFTNFLGFLHHHIKISRDLHDQEGKQCCFSQTAFFLSWLRNSSGGDISH